MFHTTSEQTLLQFSLARKHQQWLIPTSALKYEAALGFMLADDKVPYNLLHFIWCRASWGCPKNNNYSNLLILAECILSGLLSMYGNMFFFIIIYSKDNILLLYICFSFLRNFKNFINSLFNLCMRPWKYLFRVVRIN